MLKQSLAMCLLSASVIAAVPAYAQTASEKEQLQKALKDTALEAGWIYDDIDAGFSEAKKTGKPMLVVLRCVP